MLLDLRNWTRDSFPAVICLELMPESGPLRGPFASCAEQDFCPLWPRQTGSWEAPAHSGQIVAHSEVGPKRPSGRSTLMRPVRGNWQSHMASAEIAAKYNLHSLLRGMACLVCGVVNEGTQSAKTASSGRCPMPLHYSVSSPRLIIRASSIFRMVAASTEPIRFMRRFRSTERIWLRIAAEAWSNPLLPG